MAQGVGWASSQHLPGRAPGSDTQLKRWQKQLPQGAAAAQQPSARQPWHQGSSERRRWSQAPHLTPLPPHPALDSCTHQSPARMHRGGAGSSRSTAKPAWRQPLHPPGSDTARRRMLSACCAPDTASSSRRGRCAHHTGCSSCMIPRACPLADSNDSGQAGQRAGGGLTMMRPSIRRSLCS